MRQQEVDEDTSQVLNSFVDTYQRLSGGALSWDNLILTGGGGVLLYYKIKPLLKYDEMMLAYNMEPLYLVNFRGDLKLWR